MRNILILTLIVSLLSFGATAWADDWAPVNPVTSPPARSGHSMVNLSDGRVLMFGGEDANADLFNDLHVFQDGNWSAVTPTTAAPPARRDHDAWVTADDRMHVFGGLGENQQLLNDLWSFDPATNAWSEEVVSGTKPVGRYGFSATRLTDGSVLMFGGTNGTVTYNELWRLNANGTFTRLTNADGSCAYPATQLVGDYLYVFGVPNLLMVYSIAENGWYNIDIALNLSGQSCSAIGQNTAGENVVYVFGGYNQDGTESNAVYEYNTATGDLSRREQSMLYPVANGDGVVAVVSDQQALRAGEPLDCRPVADGDPLQLFFFGGISNGVPTNQTVCFSSDGQAQPPTPPPPPPPPPPVTGDLLNHIAALDHGRFTLFFARFDATQPEVKVKLAWEDSHARLSLMALGLPGNDDDLADAEKLLNFTMRRLYLFHSWHAKCKPWNRKKPQEYDTVIEKSLANVRFMVLLVKHHAFTKTARNIELTVSGAEKTPKTVLYVFPLGVTRCKKAEPRTHFVRLPVEPVRWMSKYPPHSKVEETVKLYENYWEWKAIDKTKHGCLFFRHLGFVKFILP